MSVEWWHKFIEVRALMYPEFTYKIPIMQTLQGSFMADEVHARPKFNYMTGVTVYVKLWRDNGKCNMVEIWLLYNEHTLADKDRLVYKVTGSTLNVQELLTDFIGDLK